MKQPTKGELEAARIICTAYRELLTAVGLIDDMNKLPQEIKKAAQLMADLRDKK
jgi:hypothetical protein